MTRTTTPNDVLQYVYNELDPSLDVERGIIDNDEMMGRISSIAKIETDP